MRNFVIYALTLLTSRVHTTPLKVIELQINDSSSQIASVPLGNRIPSSRILLMPRLLSNASHVYAANVIGGGELINVGRVDKSYPSLILQWDKNTVEVDALQFPAQSWMIETGVIPVGNTAPYIYKKIIDDNCCNLKNKYNNPPLIFTSVRSIRKYAPSNSASSNLSSFSSLATSDITSASSSSSSDIWPGTFAVNLSILEDEEDDKKIFVPKIMRVDIDKVTSNFIPSVSADDYVVIDWFALSTDFAIPETLKGQHRYTYDPRNGISPLEVFLEFNKVFCTPPKVFLSIRSNRKDENQMDVNDDAFGAMFSATIKESSTCGFAINLHRLDPNIIDSVTKEAQAVIDVQNGVKKVNEVLVDVVFDWIAIQDNNKNCNIIDSPSVVTQAVGLGDECVTAMRKKYSKEQNQSYQKTTKD